jgi:hypothetical protein
MCSGQRLLPALSLLVCCLLLPHKNEAQERKATPPAEECSGIVDAVDRQNSRLTLRMKSSADPNKEVVSTLSFDATLKVTAPDGTERTLEAVKAGSVVTCKESKARLNKIVLQSACTPRTCAKSNCEGKCKSVRCSCQKGA